VYTPVVPEQERLDAWDEPKVMLAGLSEQARPEEGETTEDKATVPVNPLTGATEMLDVTVTPALPLPLTGLAARLKSWAWLAGGSIVAPRYLVT